MDHRFASRVRMMIVEDSPIYLLGLLGVLKSSPNFRVAIEYHDLRTAVQQFSTKAPHIILVGLDFSLITNGASLTSDIGLAYVDGDQTFNKEQVPCLPKILSRNCFVA